MTTRPEPGTIAVVDDDGAVREAIDGLLRAEGFLVESYESAAELLGRASDRGIACLVLDVELPGRTGLELQAERPKVLRDVPIIFITGHADVPMSVRAMKAGAADFLAKPFDPDTLVEAVRAAVARFRAGATERDDIASLQARYASLTQRERQIMALVVEGRLNKQIADELGVSEITVKVQRGRAMKKMAAASLADLVRMAARLPPLEP